MTREEAYKLVTDWTENKNLIKHMLAVEAQMSGIAHYFIKKDPSSSKDYDEAQWGLAGLIHDADYDKWPKEHPKKLLTHLKENKAPEWLVSAVETHAWGFNGLTKEPSTKLEWALYTCDELSGFIIACALVRPDPPPLKASEGQGKKPSRLDGLTVESILKKWPQKAFAKGVRREEIELCEEKLGIKLEEYINICLKSLQSIDSDLGL